MPKNNLGTTLSTTFHGSSDYKLFSPNGRFYLRHQYEDISWSSSGLDVSTASAYGITMVTMGGTDPSTSPHVITLAAPIVGCEKTIIIGSTATCINQLYVDLGANVRVDGTSDARYIIFSSLAGDYQSITLQGISTSRWAVKCLNSTAAWNAATGIRGSTIALSS